MYQVFFSNRTECLLERLKETLFRPPSTPFSRRIVIVPSPAMKAWLMLQMARDPDMGIAAGLEIVYLDQALKRLMTARDCPQTQQFSSFELALAIESEIRNLIHQRETLSPHDRAVFAPLFTYLNASTVCLSRKGERRLTTLSEALSRLFIQYGTYGGRLAAEWEATPVEGWQQEIWKKIYCNTAWSYPFREINAIRSASELNVEPLQDIQVHLFAISYLPKLQHEFLLHLNQEIPITYYLLSPCQAFWSDLVSDRQSHRLQAFWKGRGVSIEQQAALEEFLRDRNPLLANFGRIGREMALQIEESQALTAEDYVLAEGTGDYPQYEELTTDDLLLQATGTPLTMLEAVQSDMTLLRTPDPNEKISLEEHDDTIQIHVASSKLREIQILYDALLQIIDRHSKEAVPICPGEIIVMIPDIQTYIPYIKAVFEGSESVLDAQIMDLPVPSTSLFIQGFMHLVNLPLGRWDAASILQLLDYPHFQKRFQFKPDEIRQIREWVKDTGTRWGEDSRHRDELLKRDHGTGGMIDASPIGTWEHAIGRLLTGLAMIVSDDHNASMNAEILPLETLDAIQGDLLGKWIKLLRSLRKDLDCLHDGTRLLLSEWGKYLQSLTEAYFDTESVGDEKDKRAALDDAIALFGCAAERVGDKRLPFSTVQHHLKETLNQQTSSYRENALHAIRFCALLPMRAIPAKVIGMVGMHTGSFPRQDVKTSLNLMEGDDRADYCPTRTDYDRFLFLEAILSARNYLVMTYQGYSGNGKEQSPSLLITELLTYLDKSFVLNGRHPSETCVKKHPFLPFDKAYYTADSSFKSYSPSQYRAAQTHYHVEKEDASSFIPKFTTAPLNTLKPEIYIDVKDLLSFARDPLKAYYNKTLGMFLPKDEDRQIDNDETFQLSHLQNYIVKQDALKLPVEHILKVAEKGGQLPLGAFKLVAVDSIKKDIASLKSNLKQLGVSEYELFKITCSDQYERPQRDQNGQWFLPPLSIDYSGAKVKIVGEFPDVCAQGMLANFKDSKSDIVKVWPQFLVFCCLIKQFELPVLNQLLLIKDKTGRLKTPFFDNPEVLLQHYLDYYFTALDHASPLIPDWLPQLIAQDAEGFLDHMQNSLNNHFQPIRSDYAQWTMKGNILTDTDLLVSHWKERAEFLFSDVYRHWYPAKAKQEQEDGTV